MKYIFLFLAILFVHTHSMNVSLWKYNLGQWWRQNWQIYKKLRLEAIKTDPQAFGVSYEQELARTDVQWQEFLNNMFFATVNGNVVAMVGILKNISEPGKHTAQVISFWVNPAYRGMGIGKKLIQHLQEYVSNNTIRKLFLYVTATQESAIRLYEKTGFEKVGVLKKHAQYNNVYLDQYIMEWHNDLAL